MAKQNKSVRQRQNSPRKSQVKKQIDVFEDLIPDLHLDSDLIQFFKDSQKFRAKEANEELEKEREHIAELKKALEEAEKERLKAESFSREAKIESIRAKKNANRALIFTIFAILISIFAGWQYYNANEANKQFKKEAEKQIDKAKKTLEEIESQLSNHK